MTALVHRLDGWMFSPAPPERLAVLRVLACAFATGYLLVRLPVFLALADLDPERFEPVGLLAPLTEPLPDGLVVALCGAALALGVAATLGWRHRWTGPSFSLVLLVLTTYRSSWGQLLHFENIMVLQVLIVGWTRSARTLSLDHRRHPEPSEPAATYGWPVRLAALATVITYVLAGVAKLRIGGLAWMLGDTLRNHVAYAAARLDLLGGTPSPAARLLVDRAWLFPPLAMAAVAIELSAPVALVGGRVRDTWVALAWLLHAGVAALMLIVFPAPLLLVAFAPFYELERLPPWLARVVLRRDRAEAPRASGA